MKPIFGPRRKYWIDAYFQKRFVGYVATIGLGIISIFYVANTYFFWRFQQQGKVAGLPENHVFFRFIESQRFQMDMIFLVTSLISLSFIILHGVRLSHKVAGPVFHLRRYLKLWKSGERKYPLRFRKTDYFQDVAVLIDDCLNDRDRERHPNQKAS